MALAISLNKTSINCAHNLSLCSSSCAGSSEESSSKPECDAPEWLDNNVAPGGYGDNTAFPPSRIAVTAEPFLSYVSDGRMALPMNITVRDAADTIVTAGQALHRSC